MKRRLQVVSDIIRHVFEPGHEVLDAVQHGVQVLAQAVELVVASCHRKALSEIALHDRAGGARCGVNPAQHAPAHDNGAHNSDYDDKAISKNKGSSQEPLQHLLAFNVTSDDQMKIAGEPGND